MKTMPGMIRMAALSLAVTAGLVLTIACGDDNGSSGTPEPTLPGDTDGGGEEIETESFDVTMGDNFFDPAEITVTGGVLAKITLVNAGKAIHNMRIAGEDDTYLNEDDAVSEPPLVNEGETSVLEWITPTAGGTFNFRCDFHPDAMVGKITVSQTEDTSGGGEEGP
jgi:plastocyanin